VIFGVGTDIVEMKRVQSIWKRFGNNFADRILMSEEMDLFEQTKDPVRFLAMRFAGKEAAVKAMGTGFSNSIWLKDVGIISNEFGKPLIIWSKRGQKVCSNLGIDKGHISLTDDAGLVIAFAITERTNTKIK
tara:strand:- start:2372 stop:2767 length:396 start_codon:yes stop_codon:yes gene_type:complete